MTRRWWGIIGIELLVGLVVLAGYQAWVQPGALRNQKAELVKQEAVIEPEAPKPASMPDPTPAAPVPAPPPQASAAKPEVTLRPESRKAQSPPKAAPKPVPEPRPTTEPKPTAEPRPAPVEPKPAAPVVSVADLVLKGQAALNTRDFAGALKLLNQAQASEPGNVDLGYLRGLALENLDQPGAAIDAYRSCTSGPYAPIAANHVKMLAAKLRKAQR